ncbi:hypothetical protein BCR39DRAFT_150219 [Naematelia encephala]|uniref:Uncharacterized protein n=1 Tax=Naematelia encephala TaxID=71784 RepID=A0A1Y2B6A2_9TREE|nr:hypothetical protein BCR39DRAFT_150219 [Naematelia encephala]
MASGQSAPPPQTQSVFAPGETVHDLLHSILGVNPFSSAPAVQTPTFDSRSPSQQASEPTRQVSVPPTQSPAPPNQVRAYSNSPAIPPGPYPPYSPGSASKIPTSLAAPVSPPAKASTPWTKIGDASFAQAAGGGSGGAPSDTDAVPGTDADLDFVLQAQTSNYSGRNGGQINQQRRRSPPKKTGQFNGHFDERAAKADTLVNGMVSRPKQFGKVPMSMINDTAKKLQFKQSLLELIHSDPAFVDELWVGYLTRRAQAGAT